MRCILALVLLLGSPPFITAQQSRQEIVRSAGDVPDQRIVLKGPSEPASISAGKAEDLTASGDIASVEDLKMPDKARKEFALSVRAFRAGDANGAVEHMKNAVSDAPNWAHAHAALAVAYRVVNQYDHSIQESERAVELNPGYREAMENLAAVLCLENRFEEAEPIARRALAIKPGAASAQYLLGGILVKERNYSTEATTLLEQSKREYPRALIFLAGAEMERREIPKAAESLREYLRLPNGQDQALAKDWLEKLKTYAQNEKAQSTIGTD